MTSEDTSTPEDDQGHGPGIEEQLSSLTRLVRDVSERIDDARALIDDIHEMMTSSQASLGGDDYDFLDNTEE